MSTEKKDCLTEYEKEKALMINEDETINDFIKIINAMNVEIPYSRYKSEKFDKYLKNIKY